VKKSCLCVRNNILKIPPPPPVPSAQCPNQMPPKSVFSANISQSARLRENSVETENVARKISYTIGHSRVSLRQYWPKNPLKWVQIEIFACFHVFDNFFANIWRCMRPRGEIVGVENIPHKFSYQIGHSRVSLHLPFNLGNH